jgi:predicted nucleotidyltransferase
MPRRLPPAQPPSLAALRKRRDEIYDVARRHGASRITIYGSVARGEETSSSDLDLLVDMEPNRTVLDLTRLRRDLEALLACRLQLTTTVRPELADSIMGPAVTL